MLRAQRNFDDVLIAYSFIFLGVPCGLGGFFRCNLIALISVVVSPLSLSAKRIKMEKLDMALIKKVTDLSEIEKL